MAFNQDPYAPAAAVEVDEGRVGVLLDEGAEESAPAAEVEAPAQEVPKGTTREIEAWVDGDKERAQLVIAHENAQEQPRKGLIRAMEELVGDDASGSA